ncbi:F-box/kelch-repeat protein At3g23880-like [Coffea arabica]|uniref:F-box/kelch-repeat protein At3g23880-like n=1 Tax=Coffea arabica TaxID=13443 RepID=A0A6P6TGS5_COFAR|nr:F-box/kelch-repeat protein At3g23880-like [Coffea arabica]
MEADEPSNPSILPSLPEDIISCFILTCLPVKTLIRLTCVCKAWRNLINSDPEFIKSHLQQSLQNKAHRKIYMRNWITYCPCHRSILDAPGFANSDNQRTIIHQRDEFMYLGMQMYVVGSSNGLLCILQDCGCSGDSILYLWNPALGQFKLLPRSICTGYWTIAVGFGYDPGADDYIVAKVCRLKVVPEGYVSYKVGIYTLRNHSWKTITFDTVPGAPRRVERHDCVGVIHEGFLYWISGTDEEGCIWLNAFDMKREIFQVITVPSYVPVNSYRRLRLFRGCVSVSGFTSGEFELWAMKEEGSWVKQFVITRNSDMVIWPHLSTTDVTSGGKILAFQAHYAAPIRKESGRLVLYDPDSQLIEDAISGLAYHDIKPSWLWFKYFVVDNYVESLVRVIPDGERKISQEIIDSYANGGEEKTKKNSRKLFGCFVCRD